MYDAIKIYFDLLEANGIRNGIEFETILADWTVVWLPAATDEHKTLATELARQVPKTPPDAEGFKTAIKTSTDLSYSEKAEIYTRFYYLIDRYSLEAVNMMEGWALFKAVWGTTWLTPMVVSTLETLATQYGIPLLPS
jgi:hypothetical protein